MRVLKINYYECQELNKMLMSAMYCSFGKFKAINSTPLLVPTLLTVVTFFCQVSYADNPQPLSGFAAALQATLEHNPAVKGKQAEVNAKGYNVDSAKARRYPALSVQANNLTDNIDQGILRLDQPLWAFGKIDTAIEQAQANVIADQLQLLQVKRQLLEETAVAYANIDGIRQRELIAKKNNVEHERLHQRISRRNEGQLASETDVRLSYSRLLRARTQLQQLQGELLVAHTELHALTQINVDTDEAVDLTLATLPSLAEVNRLAKVNSADIHFKRQQLAVVRLTVKSEKLASSPTLYFRVEHDVFDHGASVDETRVGLAFESSLEGLGLVAYGRVQGAESRLEAAKYDLSVALNELSRKVNILMTNRQVQNNLKYSQSLTVEAVEATMDSFLRQYETGRKSLVEVLNTQRDLTETRLLFSQIKSEWLTLSLKLAAITGSLDELAGLIIYE
jgi:adhesin transport system outer membrane protein